MWGRRDKVEDGKRVTGDKEDVGASVTVEVK